MNSVDYQNVSRDNAEANCSINKDDRPTEAAYGAFKFDPCAHFHCGNSFLLLFEFIIETEAACSLLNP